MMHLIKKHLVPLGVTLPQPGRSVIGGYFVWLYLPKPLNAETVAGRAKLQENLIIGPGFLFQVSGDILNDLGGCIRLCFSWEDESLLQEGIERLANAIKNSIHDAANGREFVIVDKSSLSLTAYQ
jgi:DNA-binding transcriptional MocR family regulator